MLHYSITVFTLCKHFCDKNPNRFALFCLCITEPALQILFINSSPRVSGNTLIADFTTNRPTTAECHLRGEPSKECKLLAYHYLLLGLHLPVCFFEDILCLLQTLRDIEQ